MVASSFNMEPVSTFGWILCHTNNGEDLDSPGGVVILAQADATLLCGDAVFITDGNQVNKSTTAADYDSQLGIVLAGKTNWAGGENFAPNNSDLIGKQAALATERVLICIQGLCYGIAAAAITSPAELAPDGSTAGRLVTDATPTADEIIARAFGDAAGAGNAVLVMVGFS